MSEAFSHHELYQEPHQGPAEVLTTDPQAEAILQAITSSPDLSLGWEKVRAASASRVKRWDQEPFDLIRSLLQQRPFINRAFLRGEKADIVVRAADAEHPIPVPTGILISAEGFDTWAGRSKGDKDYFSDEIPGGKIGPSPEVIAHYASLKTNSPVLKELGLYIQPDGTAFASGMHDGNHRLAAAILRGDPNVKTHSLRVSYLDRNLIG